MPATCEHLAYEVDETTRIITVVYVGGLTDEDVIGFYTDLVRDKPLAPTYDYLLDMRYTDWKASPAAIAAIDRAFNTEPSRPDVRRIAIVRKNAAAMDRRQEDMLRQGMPMRAVHYFVAMDAARAWLLTRL